MATPGCGLPPQILRAMEPVVFHVHQTDMSLILKGELLGITLIQGETGY